MTLDVLVKARREALGMSLRAVGDRAGLSAVSVMNIENGAQRDFYLSSLLGLADALRVPPRKVFEAAVETAHQPAEVVDYMKGDTSG